MVLGIAERNHSCWFCSFRRLVCGTGLPVPQHATGQGWILLRLRLPKHSRASDSSFHRRDGHHNYLHPIMRRGMVLYPLVSRVPSYLTNFPPLEPSLVVAQLHGRRKQRSLDLHVLHMVLLHKTSYPRLHLEPPVLQLQFSRLCRIRPVNGHRRVPGSVHIRTADIQVCLPLSITITTSNSLIHQYSAVKAD